MNEMEPWTRRIRENAVTESLAGLGEGHLLLTFLPAAGTPAFPPKNTLR